MIRVAVVVRSRALRAALERAVSQRASVVVVPLPVGGAAAPMAQLDADVALIDLAEWSNADGPARPSPRPAMERRPLRSAVGTGWMVADRTRAGAGGSRNANGRC